MSSVPKNIVILGTGSSGIAAAGLAGRRGYGVVLIDDKPQDVLDNLSVENFNQTTLARVHNFAGLELDAKNKIAADADIFVISPGIPSTNDMALWAEHSGKKIISEIEFAWQACQHPVIAISGTNGKTTVTELIGALLADSDQKAIVCGNIGEPFSNVVDRAAGIDFFVIEISSFQLERIENFKPKVAVLLNLAPDHMDRYTEYDEYRAAKLRIFANQEISDFAVLPSEIVGVKTKSKSTTFGVATTSNYLVRDGEILAGDQKIIELGDLPNLQSRHNRLNLAAALATQRCLGLDFVPNGENIKSFSPRRHRCEFVAEIGGVKFINDSKSTNLHSLIAAIEGSKGSTILIAGGKEKGLSYADAREVLPGSLRCVIAFGENRQSIAADWKDLIEVELTEKLSEATISAWRTAQSGDTILFSPGSSSFDQFENYAARGDAFCETVLDLTKVFSIQTKK